MKLSDFVNKFKIFRHEKRSILDGDIVYQSHKKYERKQREQEKELEDRRNWKPNRSKVFISSKWKLKHLNPIQ